MTGVRVAFVDVYVLRQALDGLEALVLRRGEHGRCPGSWETVHGTIEVGETPVQAAVRELGEETGLGADRLYNASRVEAFYRQSAGEVALVPVFVAFVDTSQEVRLSPEHDLAVWLAPREAAARFAWPRERHALADLVSLFGSGGGEQLGDVLRVG